MGRTREKNRISPKTGELLSEIKGQADMMLPGISNSYQDVSGWLKEEDYEVSESSVRWYAIRSNTAAQCLLEVQSRIGALVNVVRKNPDVDYIEAGLMLTMGGLTSRLVTVEDELDYLPLDKVGRLIVSLNRTRVYKGKARQDMKDKANLAFKEMGEEVMKTIKSDPGLKVRLKEALIHAKELMLHG